MDVNRYSTPINRTAGLVSKQDKEIKTELERLADKREDMLTSINRYRELQKKSYNFYTQKEYGREIKIIEREISKINKAIKQEKQKENRRLEEKTKKKARSDNKLVLKTQQELEAERKQKLNHENPMLALINQKKRLEKRMVLKDEIIQECKSIIGEEEFKNIVEKSKEKVNLLHGGMNE